MAGERPRGGLRAEDWFALRAPLLAFDELAALADADEAVVRARLGALLARPEVAAALWLSRPELADGVAGWRARPDGPRGRKLEPALVRLASRLATRATPLGWMAGVAVGRVAPAGQPVALGAREAAVRRAWLSGGLLAQLVAGAVTEAPPETLRVRRGPSAHRSGGRVRASTWDAVTGLERFHVVESSDAVDVLLALDETIAMRELAARVAAAVDAAPEEALDFCRDALDAGVIAPAVEMALTSSQPALDTAEALGGATGERIALAQRALDEASARPGLDATRACAALAALPEAAERPQRALAGVLCPALAQDALDPAVVASIARAVEHMAELSPAGEPPELVAFREALEARYGEEPVPLLEALDPDVGVGFPVARDAEEPWVARLGWERTPRAPAAPAAHLLRRVVAALLAGDPEVLLDEGDLAALRPAAAAPLPSAFSVAARIATAPDGQHEVYVRPPNGPGGARLLARHAVGDPSLAARLAAHLAREAESCPGALLAEIVYQPAADLADLAVRPVLRAWEIPVHGGSGAPEGQRIEPGDLVVAVDRTRLVLWSARLGREVRPRAATVLDPDACASPVYRFLCLLADADGGDGRVRWRGGALDALERVPRIRVGDAVLALARWRLLPARLGELDSRGALAALRDELELPRFVALARGEESLVFDLDNPLMVDAFLQLARRAGDDGLVLEEVWPPPDRLAVTGPGGRYVHEVVVAFTTGVARAAATPPRLARTVPRRFPPGSAWSDARVHAGAGEIDRLLTSVVAPLVRGPLSGRPWFYARAAAPDWQLRVRVRRPAAEVVEALHDALAAWIDGGDAHAVTLATYEREVERYGGPDGIELCEDWFWRDSEAALELIELLDEAGALGGAERWKLLLVTDDLILSGLELDAPDRDALVAQWRDGLAREQAGGARVARAIGELHRAERGFFDAWADHDPAGALGAELGAAAVRHAAALAEPSARIAAAVRGGRLTRSLPDIAGSLLHMHANRLLRGAPRRQEAVVWDLLARHLARRRAQQVSP